MIENLVHNRIHILFPEPCAIKEQSLQQIDKALGWLKLIEEKGLECVGCYDIHSLPDLPQENSGLYSFYHIMMDYESPNIEDWKEYKPNGQPLLLSFDDIVITRKSR